MSPVALPETAKQAKVRSFGRLFDPGGRPTLDDVVTTLWGSGDDAGGSCLVCGAVLPGPAQAADAAPPQCTSCGSRLE